MKTLLLASKEQSTIESVMELFLNHNIECKFVESELKIKTYPTSSTKYWTNPKVESNHLTVEFTGNKGLDNVEGLNQINEMLLTLDNGETLPKDSIFDIVNKLSNGNAKQVSREQKIIERYEHGIKHGSTITLEQYQHFTTHDNLKQFFITTESLDI